jgi:CBS domain containing-hemolysin-like protein
MPLRDRTADAVLRLLGAKSARSRAARRGGRQPGRAAFEPAEERNMVSGVLSLSQRSIRSIMTPRSDITWIDLDDDPRPMRASVLETPHGFFPVCRGQLDEIVGVARAKDLMADLRSHGRDRPRHHARADRPARVGGVLKVMETLKRAHGQLVLIADEYGTCRAWSRRSTSWRRSPANSRTKTSSRT